ncbi:MAG: CotH kinase family protein, partial [Myxococcales bacterium]|nr:CotH kinase family protein [Myxococcales bacterium]
ACPTCADARVLRLADAGPTEDASPPPRAVEVRPIFDGCADLYDQDIVPTFSIEIAPEEWAAIQAEFAAPREREAAGLPLKPYHPLLKFTYEGEVVEDAMIRLKGNPFYSWEPPKMQFIISFRENDRSGRFHGLRKIGLDAPWYDPTFLRERLSTAFLREARVPGACANNARLFVNGEFYGLYVNREHIDKEFLERVFDDPEGNLYKYGHELKTNEDVGDVSRRDQFWATQDLVAFEALTDRNAAVTAWAAEAMLPQYDGFWCCDHNYYLYDHPRRGFIFVLHDLDITLDRGSAQTNLVTYGSRKTLHLQLAMADAAWRADFDAAVARLLPYFDAPEFERRLDRWSAQIAPFVQRDPNLPFTVQSHFESVMQMRDWFAQRQQYLADYVDRNTRCQRGLPGADRDRDGFDECEDCDDLNRQVHAGAPDPCNERDDDCDGFIDEDADCDACVDVDLVPDGAPPVRMSLCPAPQRWYDGQTTCAARGGTLAVPAAAEVPALLAAVAPMGDLDWWTGANDGDEEARWVAPGGALIADPPWMPGQPSGDSDQNCALFVPSAGGAWNDATCTDAHPVLCRL